ncbi:integrase core domain protein [Ancylostoma duodenale]|uniref:RNA-directed DNA polymerase n=1 Tax=Ancylostoma duodenale TaxID=51022 RepID=A0A0C2GUD7_9BILA|nr:integrase core domain protein [Ancylostoma duodenale]
MKSLARSYVYWPNIDEDCERTVQGCMACQVESKTPAKVPLQMWKSAQEVWERIHFDFAGPLHGTYYRVVVDAMSKWPEIFELKNITACTTVKPLKTLFARYGNPKTLVSDSGTQFTSELFKQMCEERGVTHVRTPPYHPQSNGQAERFVDILKRGIKKLKREGTPTLRPSSNCLDTVLLAYRTTSNAALQRKSTAEVFLGRRLRTRLSMLVPRREQPEPDFAADRRKQIEAQFNRKHGARSREFSSGDTVMMKSHRGASEFEWTEGTVIKRTGRVTYQVEIGGKHVLRHANQMRKMMSGHENDTSSSRNLLLDLFETDPLTTESVPDRSEDLRVEDQSEVVDSREPSGNSILGNIEPSDLTTQENGNGLPRRRTVTFAPLPVRKSTRQRRPPNRYEP